MRSHRTHGWLVLESGSVSYGKATPYLPLIELLKAYCRIQERDDPREIRERVAGKLLTLDRALEPLLTPLLALLDVPAGDAAWDALDPAQRRQRTLEAVKRLLLRESQVQPLLMIFEDLHWIDSETQTLLDGLIESLPTARVLLLVNYRPEYEHAWGRKTYYRQLRIDPLPPQSAEALLNALLGEDQALEPLKRMLIERTEGNPFFLEESVQTLVETKVLVGERGAYRMAKAPESWQIPATAQAILAARIDRLAPEDKRLLQAASVIGKDVPFALLHAIADMPEESLRRGLTDLQAAEFLYETSLWPDIEYTFKHALTHDVTYGNLLQDRRRQLHARIVDAIEALYPERLTEQVERLAHHAFRGEVWGKAVTYLRQAGAKAFARSAHRESAVCVEHAIAALSHLPEARETLEQGIDLRFDLRNALTPLAEFQRVDRDLRDAEGLAERLDDRRRLGWISVYRSVNLWLTGHTAEAQAVAERAHVLAETLRDPPLQIAATYYLGVTCLSAGDHSRAEGFLRATVQWLPDDRRRERFGLAVFLAATSRGYLAWTLAEQGVFEEGITHGREGVRMGEAVEHPYSLAVACWNLAHLYGAKGEFNHARPLLERALALARDWNITFFTPVLKASLGDVYARTASIGEGIAWLQEALTDYEAAGIGVFHSKNVVQLGEAYLLAGRIGEARACGDRAVTLARQHGERGYEARALRLLAEIASHCDHHDAETAEGHYRQALALAEELSMRPFVAHCHLGLGKLYRRTGDQAKAKEHLVTATTMYREMDMRFWLEQAESATAELA